jgi:hypothetical protein
MEIMASANKKVSSLPFDSLQSIGRFSICYVVGAALKGSWRKFTDHGTMVQGK